MSKVLSMEGCGSSASLQPLCDIEAWLSGRAWSSDRNRRCWGWHTWPLTNLCMCSGKLMSMAGVLSQCLGSRSADDANRLMQPVVRAVTKDVQLGAKPATSSSTAKNADQVALEAIKGSASKDAMELLSA